MTMMQHNSVKSADEGFTLGRVAALAIKRLANRKLLAKKFTVKR